jgi:hypothetical protein
MKEHLCSGENCTVCYEKWLNVGRRQFAWSVLIGAIITQLILHYLHVGLTGGDKDMAWVLGSFFGTAIIGMPLNIIWSAIAWKDFDVWQARHSRRGI